MTAPRDAESLIISISFREACALSAFLTAHLPLTPKHLQGPLVNIQEAVDGWIKEQVR